MSLLCGVRDCPNAYTVWIRTDGMSCGLCDAHCNPIPKTTAELMSRCGEK